MSDSIHGLILGGPDDGKINTEERLMETGYVRYSHDDERFHFYAIHERGDGTKLFIYNGSSLYRDDPVFMPNKMKNRNVS